MTAGETKGDKHVAIPVEASATTATGEAATDRAPPEPPHVHAAHHISAAFAEKHFIPTTAGADAGAKTKAPASASVAAASAPLHYYPDTSSAGSDLFRAVRDAGRWSFGVVAVECWVMNDNIHKLERPPGGVWVDPAFLSCEIPKNVALMRLLDESRKDYVPPAPLGPGVGLPGALWAETAEATAEAKELWDMLEDVTMRERELDRVFDSDRTEEDSRRRGKSRRTRGGEPSGVGGFGLSSRLPTVRSAAMSVRNRVVLKDDRRVGWREVGPLALDPDQPYNPRLILLARAGFNLAAGVRFNLSGHRGVAIYYARGTADIEQLNSKNNYVYLRRAADAIGAASALEEPRRKCIKERKREGHDAWRRARNKISIAVATKAGLHELAEGSEKISVSGGKEKMSFSNQPRPDDVDTCLVERWKAFKRYLKKCAGGNNKPPPPFSNKEALFTFLGCFISLIVLTQSDRLIRINTDNLYLVLGPFGAFMTLQYGLTAAPASQPWNAMWGQAISITIANAISYAEMPNWAKQTVATSLAVAVMVRLGITHPPAGAAALLFSTNHDWAIMALALFGNIVAIVIATLINNLNHRRQYPTFWGRVRFRDMFRKEKDPMLKPEKKV